MRVALCARVFVLIGVMLCAEIAHAEYQVMARKAAQGPSLFQATTNTAPVFEMRPSDNTVRNRFTFTLLYEIAVFDTRTGAIIPNATITLSMPMGRANSGGHDHDDAARPAGSFSYSTGNTGPSGVDFSPVFTAPEVSGIVDVVVSCSALGLPCLSSTLPIAVRIPDLVELPGGVDYQLTGSFGSPGVTSRHVGNHFGTQSFVSKLQVLATQYFIAYMSQSNQRLQFNDMSLIEGGLFDVGNGWSPAPDGHFEHRIGISVDVGLVPLARRNSFTTMLTLSGITGVVNVEGNHWHVRETGSSQ